MPFCPHPCTPCLCRNWLWLHLITINVALYRLDAYGCRCDGVAATVSLLRQFAHGYSRDSHCLQGLALGIGMIHVLAILLLQGYIRVHTDPVRCTFALLNCSAIR